MKKLSVYNVWHKGTTRNGEFNYSFIKVSPSNLGNQLLGSLVYFSSDKLLVIQSNKFHYYIIEWK